MPVPITTNNVSDLPMLNLPDLEIDIRPDKFGNVEIFDIFRQKYIMLTHEEWVRQSFAQYLVYFKNYPKSRIKLEHQLLIADNPRRCDIVYFDKFLNPELIVECKSAKIRISKSTFNQIALYNSALKVKYLIVTNGLMHYSAEIDYKNHSYNFLDFIPDYIK